MAKTLKYKPYNGLQVFCTNCGSTIHRNSNMKKGCQHPLDKQVYKAVLKVPNTNGRRKTKNLVAKTFDDAVVELIQFKKTVKDPYSSPAIVEEYKPMLLRDCIAMYIDYQCDIDVPYHQKKHLDRKYIITMSGHFKNFKRFVKENIKELNTFRVNDINNMVIGKYVECIEKQTRSNYTFNHRIKAMRGFFTYLIEEKNYRLDNLWKKVKLRTERAINTSISADEFYSLLDIITPNDSFKTYSTNRKKNMYMPWLKNAIMLSAFTGRRNEEIFMFKWNMIMYNSINEPIILKSFDIKVNKLQNNTSEDDMKVHYIPVGEELKDLLMELGFADERDSNNYIIAADVSNRRTLKEGFGCRFSFYFEKLDKGYVKQLKHLRKTFITQQDLMMNSRISLQHSNYSITAKHYIDLKVVAEVMVKKGFRVFPERNSTKT